MNPDLNRLQPYPFQKLARLKEGITPPGDRPHIALSVGEPKHAAPDFVAPTLAEAVGGLSVYPLTRGEPTLREAISDWATRRFTLKGLDPSSQVLPVNGTREALFAFAQAVIDDTKDAVVISPNPFYQIYEGAALLAGARPYFVDCRADTGLRPDWSSVPDSIWEHCQLLYLCSPGNPTGAVIPQAELQQLITLADRHDFIIASDECYSELYPDETNPPVGLLQACAAMGRDDYRRCLVFHSLSKRSNLPGLRSGFVAGDAALLEQFFMYRTYHGCAMPLHHQQISIAAWRDEQHVLANRQLYRDKFDAVLEILSPVMNVSRPDAGFYLWPETPIDDESFAQRLFAGENVTVLPGSYLSRETDHGNPGRNRVRMALVATLDECVEAAGRIRRFVETL